MSAKLFYYANCKLMRALEADDSRKQMFFIVLDTEAISKKNCGYISVVISIHIDKFSAAIENHLHFFTSASKFDPNFAANKMPPNYPRPSLSTH